MAAALTRAASLCRIWTNVRRGGMPPDEVLVDVCGPKGFERFCIDGFVLASVRDSCPA